MAIGAQGEAKGLSAGRDRGGDPASGQIDPDQAEIAAVQHQQFIGVGVVQQIGGEAVLVVDRVRGGYCVGGRDATVERDGIRSLERSDVESDDGSIVAAAEIDSPGVSGKGYSEK